jgi:hypothetical protein
VTRTVPSALQASIASGVFALAVLVKIVRQDGAIDALTSWNEPLYADLDGEGPLFFSPVDLTEVAEFSAQINTAIDDSEIKVPLNTVFTGDDVRRGFLAQAEVRIGYVDPNDLANPWLHRVYKVGQIGIDGAECRLELMGIEKALEVPVGRPLTANCQFEFGSALCGIPIAVDAWQGAQTYVVGDQVKPTAGGSLWFICTVAGTAGVSEPTWASGTVVDNTVTWASMRARVFAGTVSSVATDRSFTATGISVVADYFGEGMLTWLTGDNAGQRMRVRSDNGSGTIVQHDPCLDPILAGDTFEISVGCRHRYQQDCIDKHDNQHRSSSRTLRFGGDPFLAPENVTISAPTE